MSGPAREWWVFVHPPGPGYLGTVMESNEELARLAALSRYSRGDDERPQGDKAAAIFADDDFDVRPAK